ncbi:hypothetical protein BpHYR1_007986 [Brachionus plicatilis]|uniref:Uncharacterized protein n=1 Tax=Brachionus plicatilis TaxID=10195 RepID=A0A3M7PEC0_BRAPC|nr:hypothetical protein BpHYR1_007986 [Brachionus plicatilis]
MAEELNELKKLKLSVSQTDGINNNSQTKNHESKLSPPSGGISSKNSTESSTETHNNYTPAFLGDLRYPSVKKTEIELKNVPKFYGNINDDVDAWIFVIESQAANLGFNEADLPMAVIPFLRGSALSTIKNMIMKNKNLKWDDIKAHFKKLMLRQIERLDEALNVVKVMHSCMGSTSYNTDKVNMARYVGSNKSKQMNTLVRSFFDPTKVE